MLWAVVCGSLTFAPNGCNLLQMANRIVVLIPEPDHRKVKAKAAAEGLSLTGLVLKLLALWLDGKVKVS